MKLINVIAIQEEGSALLPTEYGVDRAFHTSPGRDTLRIVRIYLFSCFVVSPIFILSEEVHSGVTVPHHRRVNSVQACSLAVFDEITESCRTDDPSEVIVVNPIPTKRMIDMNNYP